MSSAAAPDPGEMQELEFTVFGFIAKPPAEVYEAVADPGILSRYFTTGGASGRAETGATVQWDFADFPGAFPVEVLSAEPPERIVLRWGGEPEATVDPRGTEVAFVFTGVDAGSRTEVRITERAWRVTAGGAQGAFGNCMGWSGMLAAMKAWLEHGINLREGFYR
ncbi:SRPBCC domain-containing protein [Leucobacter allii]|uniref:SRPBCC domain-containing protein n=1 Tax=Leucobacter allii TaxID=2932247 RepID=A0ABY4FPK7_9MICO|nr:SRPBCC domain-containing protein [Leucobacter allii]UOQ58210.1 SRPBCC domain-containing protein [Leucobacter allii]UOR02792.1 SRPBCC domain-containing protein [Leucobacter allii]